MDLKDILAPGTSDQPLCDACRQINIERLATAFVLVPKLGIFPPGQTLAPPTPDPRSASNSLRCSFCDEQWIFPKTASFLVEVVDPVGDGQPPRCSKVRLTYPPEYIGARMMGPPYDFDIWTEEGDPAVEFGVRTRRTLTRTSSDETVSWIKEKLHQCHSTHKRCHRGQNRLSDHISAPAPSGSPPHAQQTVLPKSKSTYPRRLLDLRGSGNLDCVLVSATSFVDPVYAVLSYCWGTAANTGYKTTVANISAYQHAIPYSGLPLTIRHAIDITRRLGINYLWVDALCIIQGLEEDWDEESANMHSIYSNAEITISADSSTGVHAGIFNKSSEALDLKCTKVVSTLSDGRRSCLYFCRMASEAGDESLDSAPRDQPLNRNPLASRAWAFQERRLSTRIIHFHEKQAIWECMEEIGSEDNTWEALVVTAPRSTHHAPSILLRSPQETSLIADTWYGDIDGILYKYLNCQLTFPNDKLPAIAGVAAMMARHTVSPYVAGLWLNHSLHRGLAWQRRVGHDRTWIHRPERGPSFSWVSWDGPFRWSLADAPPAFKLEGFYLKHQGNNRFGRVDSCSLELTGHIQSASIRHFKDSRMPGLENHIYFGDRRDKYAIMDDINFLEHGNVELFLLFEKGRSSQALVLEKDYPNTNKYRRLGLADLSEEISNEVWHWPVRKIVLI